MLLSEQLKCEDWKKKKKGQTHTSSSIVWNIDAETVKLVNTACLCPPADCEQFIDLQLSLSIQIIDLRLRQWETDQTSAGSRVPSATKGYLVDFVATNTQKPNVD